MADGSGPYDIVVLGGGSGGYACALRAAELGKTVALIEKDKIGGTCLHRGCIPTKALLHSAEVADETRESATYGVKARFEGIDVPGVHAFKDKIVTRAWKGVQGLLKSKGVTIVEGEGRLVGSNRVAVGDDRLRGPQHRAGDRLRAQVPARSGDRRRADHHQRARAQAGPGARLGGRPGRRRHRRRVRQRLAFVRRRGDDRRGPAAPAPAGGGVELQAAGARLPPPRHQAGAGRVLRGRQDHRHRRGRHARQRQDPRRRAAARRRRPRRRLRRHGPRGGGRRDRARHRHRERVLPDQRAGRLRGRRPDPDPAARSRGLRRGHPGGRAHRRAQPGPDRLRRRAADHLLRPRGRLGGHHLRPGQGARPRDRRAHLRPRGQPQEPDPADTGRGQDHHRRRTARCSACTWSAVASASS